MAGSLQPEVDRDLPPGGSDGETPHHRKSAATGPSSRYVSSRRQTHRLAFRSETIRSESLGRTRQITNLRATTLHSLPLRTTAEGHQVRAGKAKGLALTAKERSPLLPQVPTAALAGLIGYERPGSASWCRHRPRGPIFDRLNRELGAIAQLPKCGTGWQTRASMRRARRRRVRPDDSRGLRPLGAGW